MSNNTALLSIEGLHNWFTTPGGTVRAVSDVSLTIDAARRLGVVGESGSGKTQTFFGVFGLSGGSPGVVAGRARFGAVELLGGLERFVQPTTITTTTNAADVRKNISGWNRHQQRQLEPIMGRDVGILFQDPKRSLIPYWKVGRQIDDVLRRRTAGVPEVGAAAQLLATLGFRDTTRILDSFPEALSGGEAQRVLLAITLGMKPQLLVADEPTTGLDLINQAKVLDALLQVQSATDMAMVLISHDLAVVDAMVDDVVVMFGGRVVERSTAAALRAPPDAELHPYTRALRDSQRRRSTGAPINATVLQQSSVRAKAGCPFQHRCQLKPQLSSVTQNRCTTEIPVLTAVGPEHEAACWGLAS